MAKNEENKTEKVQKVRKCRYRMNGGYKGQEKRRAYLISASQLSNVVKLYHGQPQIYRNEKWGNLSKSELANLVKAEMKAKEKIKEAEKEKEQKAQTEN